MDIAEIRKKAAAGKSDPAGSLPVDQERKLVSSTPVVEEEADRQPLYDESGCEDRRSESQMSGLDKLFASHQGFELATEETYQQTLTNRDDQADEDVRQYLAFHLDREEYAMDIRQISEIIKVRELTEIPRVPDFVLGVISLRGLVVPVFDLSQRLQLGKARLSAASRIVVCQVDDSVVGLLVDSINQVIHLPPRQLEPPPGSLSGLDREMIAGVGRFQGSIMIILNLSKVMNVDVSC
ncbi:MAG: hypothetical protein C0614_12500 [Desulfuromonas sp.]|nr:MAG: hypothetical protein C0614_12500 [Desulfuromonas sp.]